LSREVAWEEKRLAILDSKKGVEVANQEIKNLYAELEKFALKFAEEEPSISFQHQQRGNEFAIYAGGFTLRFLWSNSFRNTLDSSALYILLFKGIAPIDGRSIHSFEKPKKLKEIEYNFDLKSAGEHGWREFKGKKRFNSTKRLIETSLNILFEKIRMDKIKK